MSARNLSLSSIKTTKENFASKQVIFCDFDGPIVDVSDRYYQTYRKGLLAIETRQLETFNTTIQIQPLSKQQFWQMKQNRVADIEIAIRSGLPAELFGPFIQQVERIVNHPSLLQWDCLQPAAQTALRYFDRCEMRFVLVTLRHPRQVRDFLKAQKLEHLVDEVYGACNVGAAQANRVEQKLELLAEAIAQQKAQGHCTQNSWMVGDTEADILAGQAAGLSTAALSCGARSSSYLERLKPSKVYSSLMMAAREVVNPPVFQAA